MPLGPTIPLALLELEDPDLRAAQGVDKRRLHQGARDHGIADIEPVISGDNGLNVGNPVVEGALVKASFVDALRGPKIRVFKYKKRKGYRRTKGHRQNLHRVRIEGIELPS